MPQDPLASASQGKTAPRVAGRWTLLLVADDGRLRQIPHLKAMLTAAAVALGLSLACVLVVFSFYNSARRQNIELTRHLEDARQSLATAREQNQLLLAKAVIAGPQDAVSTPAADQAAAVPVAPDGRTGPAPTTAAGAGPSLVEAQELSFTPSKTGRHFQVQFKLKNNGSEADPAVGYAFVLLYPQDQTSGKGPVVIPDTALDGQRPLAFRSGRPFTITRFTTIRLEGRDNDPGRFASAVVLAFDKNGSLVLEQRFELSAQDKERSAEQM